jgi:zinc transporter 1/2/3
MSDLNCSSGGGATTYPQLRIASIFIVLIGSMGGATFPVLSQRTSWLHVPKAVFE